MGTCGLTGSPFSTDIFLVGLPKTSNTTDKLSDSALD